MLEEVQKMKHPSIKHKSRKVKVKKFKPPQSAKH